MRTLPRGQTFRALGHTGRQQQQINSAAFILFCAEGAVRLPKNVAALSVKKIGCLKHRGTLFRDASSDF